MAREILYIRNYVSHHLPGNVMNKKLTELCTVKMIIARRKIQLVRVKTRNEKMYCLSDRFGT